MPEFSFGTAMGLEDTRNNHNHNVIKFDIGDLLTISYLHTYLRPNLKGVVIFCVDLARNDPLT